MRVTSPPKHPSEFRKKCLNTKAQNSLNGLFQDQIRQNQPIVGDNSVKLQNKNMKEKMYEQLRNKQQQYVQLIKDLHQQNEKLKAQLGKKSLQQCKRQGASTALNRSPDRNNQNQAFYATTPDFQYARKNQNQREMNQTFDNFNSFKRQSPKYINVVSSNLSAFSKNPLILQNLSPNAFRKSSINSPSSFQTVPSNRPVSFMVMKSPQKKVINHSYNPSVVSYGRSTPQTQSLNCSPNKGFSTVVNSNSQTFAHEFGRQGRQNNLTKRPFHAINQLQKPQQPPNSLFSDNNKRQTNQGSVLMEPSITNQCQNTKTFPKMSTPNIDRDRQSQIALKEEDIPINPLTYKRNKQTKRARFQPTDNNQIRKTQQKSFNLQERITQNPLMNMLKNKLQQGEQLISQNKFGETQNQSKQATFNMTSQWQHDESIRYTSPGGMGTGQILNQINNVLYNPLRRNLVHGLPIFHQLTKAQSNYLQGPQDIYQGCHYDQAFSRGENNNPTDPNGLAIKAFGDSRLINLQERQDESEQMNQQTENRRKALTIVRMLDENFQRQNDSQLRQDQLQLIRQQNSQEVNFIQIQNEGLYKEYDGQIKGKEDLIPISDKQEYQNNEQDMRASLNLQAKIVSPNEKQNQAKNTQNKTNLNQSYFKQLRNQQCEEHQGVSDQWPINQNNVISQKLKEEHQVSQTQSDRQRMNRSSQYKLFYGSHTRSNERKDKLIPQIQKNQPQVRQQEFAKTWQQNRFISPRNSVKCQKFKDQEQSDCTYSSVNTLRSQRFKKISNDAYL